jgi:hypothetical protein
MAKRAKKRRTNAKQQRTAERSTNASTRRKSTSKRTTSDKGATTSQSDVAIPETASQSDVAIPETASQCDVAIPETASQCDLEIPKSASQCDLELPELVFDPLEDPFFYESPFPPEVVLDDAVEPPHAVYTPAMIARRRKLRTFVAMVVGVAAAIMLLGIGKTMLVDEGVAQLRSMTVPVSP